ncbi:MAG: SCP-2 sterol transfer family protein [Firmicutes bacterium]|nr:SCP-2 sterol transfer family protein [Bacillota bacterium]
MLYEEIFERAKKQLLKAKVGDIKELIAVQFNIIGEGHGSFYAEIENGKIDVQPYNYWDNDISLNVFAKELLFALENKAADKLGFYGDNRKIDILKPVLMTIPKARKTAEKAK